MKVFEDKRRFEGHRLQIAKRLGWFFAVVKCLGARLVVSWASGGKASVRDQFSELAAAPDQSAGNTPLKGGEVEERARGSYQTHGPHLFHGFHHHNRSGRAEQDFQALQGIWHKGMTVYRLTSWDLLP